MADNSELEFRQFSRGEIGKLQEVYELCFGKGADDRYFNWKYYENPVGDVVAFAAYDGDTVAAFYGVIPELYMVNGKQKKIYQSMDTMTHPNYQRRGLFGKVATMTYDRVAELEGELKILGIAGTSSHPGFIKKLKWKDVNLIKYFFTNKSLFKLASVLRRSKKVEFEKVTGLGQELAGFFANREISSKPIQPHLSSDFFEWRVFKNPNKDFQVLQIEDNGQIIGVCVYTIAEKNRCFIDFLSFSRESFFDDYVSAVIDFLFDETKAQFVYTWEPPSKILYKNLKKLGFLTNPLEKGLFSYRTPMIVRAEPETTDGTSWLDINNFDVQPLMQD